jgi:TraK protein
MKPRRYRRLLVSLLAASVVGSVTRVQAADSPPATTTRLVEYAGKPVRVRLTVGKTTQVEVPEAVVDMVTMIEATHLTLSYTGHYVQLHALTAVEGEVFVITTSGASYPLAVTTNASQHDAAVRIVTTGTRAKKRQRATQSLTAVGLIRAMARGEIPPGVEHLPAKGQQIYHDGTVRLTLQAAYLSPRMRGYILQAENLTGVSVPVPVEELEIPGLLAVGSFTHVLYPQPRSVEERLAGAYQSLVYVVVRRDAATPEPAEVWQRTAGAQ